MSLTFNDIVLLRDLQVDIFPKLEMLCEQYFKETEPDWQYYDSWVFGSDNDIIITYKYYSDCEYHHVEYDRISIPIKTLLEYNDR